MPAFLLTWNPKHSATGGEDSAGKSFNYTPGDEVRWSCNSQQPRIGDRVYLIRLGTHQHPKGIVACGTVTQESFADAHWSDNSKQSRYIKFRMEDLRQSCAEGLLPMLLLKVAFPGQQWSPNASGIEIAKASLEALNNFWEGSKGQHSLTTMLQWCFEQRDDGDWLSMYQNLINQVRLAKETREIPDELLKKLWFDRNNGVTSVAPAGLPEAEYRQNADWLREMTFRIFHSPDAKTLTVVYDHWREHFSKTYWSVIQRMFSAADPEHLTSLVNYKYVARVTDTIQTEFQVPVERDKNWCTFNHNLIDAIAPLLQGGWNSHERNIALWYFYEHVESLKNSGQQDNAALAESSEVVMIRERKSVNGRCLGTNTILYGPPGTGKTYHTVDAAVKAADPSFESVQDRSKLKERYEQLVIDGRIRFVTFHQSFSYEEFVEGLRANSEDGAISYDIEPGIFKRICEAAALEQASDSGPLDDAIDRLVEHLREGESLILKTKTGKSIDVAVHGTESFRITPEDSSYDKIGKGYSVPFNHIRYLYRGVNLKKIYYPSYAKTVLGYIQSQHQISDYQPNAKPVAPEQFVLVIDEINRGNISKIFGELITLIEPAKRAGQPEALSVHLPYSREEFLVPDNLHIIGTMNTADRSLAMMDTALRRRFDFREMMPNPGLLDDVQVQGVNMGAMLRKINQRIEFLYDREHTLGHAFFMSLQALQSDDERFVELQSIFRNKVIPLLEEYFFEDWQKIRLVLADNQTTDPALQFVQDVEVSTRALFGHHYQDNALDGDNVSYRLNTAAFENIGAYRKIIGVPLAASGSEPVNG